MMESSEILEKLPHGFPFVFVDRVIYIEPGVRAVALKNVTVNERIFLGHFPRNPVLPGVLVAESLAQTGGLAVAKADGESWVLAEIKDLKFKNPVLPGDQMVLTVEVEKSLGNMVRFSGRAVVGDKVAAEGLFTLAKHP